MPFNCLQQESETVLYVSQTRVPERNAYSVFPNFVQRSYFPPGILLLIQILVRQASKGLMMLVKDISPFLITKALSSETHW